MIDKNIKLAFVIDDDEVIKYLTEKMFVQIALIEKTEFFSDPKYALEHLKTLKPEALPDMILLDLKMPGMDGWHFLDAIGLQPLLNEIPVFIFTSSINDDDITRSLKYSNVKDYIIKPLTVHKVSKMLRQLS